MLSCAYVQVNSGRSELKGTIGALKQWWLPGGCWIFYSRSSRTLSAPSNLESVLGLWALAVLNLFPFDTADKVKRRAAPVRPFALRKVRCHCFGTRDRLPHLRRRDSEPTPLSTREY